MHGALSWEKHGDFLRPDWSAVATRTCQEGEHARRLARELLIVAPSRGPQLGYMTLLDLTLDCLEI